MVLILLSILVIASLLFGACFGLTIVSLDQDKFF